MSVSAKRLSKINTLIVHISGVEERKDLWVKNAAYLGYTDRAQVVVVVVCKIIKLLIH